MNEQTQNTKATLPALSFGLLLLGVAVGLMVNLKILDERDYLLKTQWQAVPVKVPTEAPPIGQASIDTALLLFNIRIPANASHPTYTAKLTDRGLASRQAWSEKIRVEIGPSAFASWGILGSTLAHELEVHCMQNFALINLMDIVGLQGSKWAERQAYLYEIKQSRRFGLPAFHTQAIADTMRYYYDVDQMEATKSKSQAISNLLGKRISRWFARSSLTP